MKTVKGSTITLNPFQETISLLYNIDANKDKRRLDLIEQESTILYYVSDVQYTILKRNIESELGRTVSFEEMNAILSKQSFRIKPLDLTLLGEEDIKRINLDINYLSKYNEIYDNLNCNEKIVELLLNLYAKRLHSILEFGSLLDNVKKHQILVKLGIEEHLKRQNKNLDERVAEHRATKQQNDDSLIKIISATIAKSHVK